MLKMLYISLSLLFFGITSLNSQSSDPYNLDSLSGKELYKWVNSFNDHNQKNKIEKRSGFTHKLIGGINYTDHVLFPSSKGQNIYETDREISVRWDFNNDDESWIPTTYSAYHFNNDSLLLLSTYNSWDGDFDNINEDSPLLLRKYRYNSKNQIVQYQSQSSTAIQLGFVSFQTNYTYDENTDLLIGQSDHSWNYDLDTLEFRREIIYRHNNDNQLEQIVELQLRDDIGWYYVDSTYMIYNDKNQLEIEKKYSQGPILDTFKFSVRKNYVYNDNGTLNHYMEYRGKRSEDPYDWSTKRINTYDYYPYGSLKEFGTYDSTYLWPYDKERYYSSSYIYDENVSVEQVQFPRIRILNSLNNPNKYENHMILQETHYINGNSLDPIFLDYRIEFLYSELETNTTEEISKSPRLDLIPNPSSDFVKIRFPDYSGKVKLSIMNTQGRIFRNEFVVIGDNIDISDYVAGVYIYSVEVEGKLYGGKLVVY